MTVRSFVFVFPIHGLKNGHSICFLLQFSIRRQLRHLRADVIVTA